MTFQSPGAILFQVGIFSLHWYGLTIALGFITASIFLNRLAKVTNLPSEQIINCALTTFVGGVIGARLYFALLNWPYFSHHLIEIFETWLGGMSIHGGLIGGTIFGIIYCRIKKLSILPSADLLATVMPLAQAIGRWGNFFNSEAFGKPVSHDFPLKLYIPPEHRPQEYAGYAYFHPTFLYESLWNCLVFIVLYNFLFKRLRNQPGLVFCLYLMAYSLGRLLIEPIRSDSIMLAELPVPIIASAITLIFSLLAMGILFRHYQHQ